jgi:hypothetical protein
VTNRSYGETRLKQAQKLVEGLLEREGKQDQDWSLAGLQGDTLSGQCKSHNLFLEIFGADPYKPTERKATQKVISEVLIILQDGCGVLTRTDEQGEIRRTALRGKITYFTISGLTLSDSEKWKNELVELFDRARTNGNEPEQVLTEDIQQSTLDQHRHNIILPKTETIGRESFLQRVHQAIQAGEPKIALYGMGGIGKTQLALEYVRSYADQYSAGICWIFVREKDHDFGTNILAQIRSFWTNQLKRTKPDNLSDEEEFLYYINNWVSSPSSSEKVLLIFDDVEDQQQVLPYVNRITNPQFKVVLTTRLSQFPEFYPVEVTILDRPDSIMLLKSIMEEDLEEEDSADELCEFVGDLPLGLELVAHYLRIYEDQAIKDLVERLKEKAEQRSVPFDTSFERQGNSNVEIVARRGLDAAFALTWDTYLSLYDKKLAIHFGDWTYPNVNISWKTLNQSIELHSQEHPGDGEYNEEQLLRSRRNLELYSLIKPIVKRTKRGDSTLLSYSIHPLVREFFRSRIDEYGNRSIAS